MSEAASGGDNERARSMDILIHPGMKSPKSSHPFFKKHGKSIMTAFLISKKEPLQKLIKMESYKKLLGAGLIASMGLNIVQAHYPQQHALSVSLSSPDHDIIHTTTITVPLNTNRIVLDWAQNAICSSLTMRFSDYKTQLQNARQYFTEGGYAGFMDAMESDFLPDIINNRLLVTVAPAGAVVVRHNPNYYERWWDIEVPIVMTFSAGTKRSTTAVRKLAMLRVVPVKPSVSITGKAIESVTLDAMGED